MPWSADTVRPGVKLLLPGVERFAVSRLKRRAAPLGREAVALVETRGAWGDVTKTALAESSAAVVAKYMNKFGVSAEFAPEVALVGAVGSLLSQHAILMGELDALVAEQKRADQARAQASAPADKGAP